MGDSKAAVDEVEWSPFVSSPVSGEIHISQPSPFNNGDALPVITPAADLASIEWALPNTMSTGLGTVFENDSETSTTWQQQGYAFDPSQQRPLFDPLAVKPCEHPVRVTRGLSVFDPLSEKNSDCLAALGGR